MPKILNPIKQRAFEVIRNRIAEILTDELPYQSAMNYDEMLDATVFLERSIPIDATEMPCVNVMLSEGDFDNYKQAVKDGNYTYLVDVYQSAPADDNNSGDQIANLRLHRLVGVIDAILSDTRYRTLGFKAPFISRVEVRSVKIADPSNNKDANNVAMARMEFHVRVPESVEFIQPILLEGYSTEVKLGLTNQGYVFSGTASPAPTPVCDPVLVQNSDGSYSVSEASGGTVNLPDISVTLNGGGFLSWPSAKDLNIELLQTGTNAEIVPDLIDGNKIYVSGGVCADANYEVKYQDGTPIESGTIPSGGSKLIEVANCPPAPTPLNTSNPIKTGVTTSYVAGDDGNTQIGRNTDWFNIDFINPVFSNQKRFTGTTGGYQDESDNNYYDVDGVTTTEALAFPDGIIIDWASYNQVNGDVLMYEVTGFNFTLDGCISDAQSRATGGYNDWRVTNFQELVRIINPSNISTKSVIDYPPFNVAQSATGDSIWTNSGTDGGANPHYVVLFSNGNILLNNITSTQNNNVYFYIAIRTGNISEL